MATDWEEIFALRRDLSPPDYYAAVERAAQRIELKKLAKECRRPSSKRGRNDVR